MALQRIWALFFTGQDDLTENDPHKVLGLGLAATEDDIKNKYQQLYLVCHPEKNPDDINATQKFQQLSEAYHLLMDPEFRESYSWAKEKLPSICSALRQYALRPRAAAFMVVYTAVFDITQASKQDPAKLEQILTYEISHSIGKFAGCLRKPLHELPLSWMKNAISEMHRVRNHLYCLQSGFAHGGRSRDFSVSFQAALRNARCVADIDGLAQGFWQNVIEAVKTSVECAMILPDLIGCWCRLGCPIVGLRVPALTNDSQVFDAMRAAFAAYNAKRLSPGLLIPVLPVTCPFHITNRSLITMVAGFLSREDLLKSFCLHRGSGRGQSCIEDASVQPSDVVG